MSTSTYQRRATEILSILRAVNMWGINSANRHTTWRSEISPKSAKLKRVQTGVATRIGTTISARGNDTVGPLSELNQGSNITAQANRAVAVNSTADEVRYYRYKTNKFFLISFFLSIF